MLKIETTGEPQDGETSVCERPSIQPDFTSCETPDSHREDVMHRKINHFMLLCSVNENATLDTESLEAYSSALRQRST